MLAKRPSAAWTVPSALETLGVARFAATLQAGDRIIKVTTLGEDLGCFCAGRCVDVRAGLSGFVGVRLVHVLTAKRAGNVLQSVEVVRALRYEIQSAQIRSVVLAEKLIPRQQLVDRQHLRCPGFHPNIGCGIPILHERHALIFDQQQLIGYPSDCLIDLVDGSLPQLRQLGCSEGVVPAEREGR